MGVKDHRRRAEGKSIKRLKRRMPAPEDCKLGTRVHESERYDLDDDELEVQKCVECDRYTPVTEIDNDGLCFDCVEALDREEFFEG